MAESGESHRYPGRLYHETPSWVAPGVTFHIRLRCATGKSNCLTEESIARLLLVAAENYHVRGRWYCHLMLLMPDHVHALLSFPMNEWMSRVVGEWKAYATRILGVRWQPNFFDYRIRHRDDFAETFEYIRRNPVAKGLCAKPEDWPWVWSSGQMVEPAVPTGWGIAKLSPPGRRAPPEAGFVVIGGAGRRGKAMASGARGHSAIHT